MGSYEKRPSFGQLCDVVATLLLREKEHTELIKGIFACLDDYANNTDERLALIETLLLRYELGQFESGKLVITNDETE